MGIKPRKTQERFVSEANEVHNFKYDYSETKYIEDSEKVTIKCKDHGYFIQCASSHLQGCGCPKCARIRIITAQTFTLKEFIDKSNKIHNFNYDYSKVEYKRAKDKVIIICNNHGEFEQEAYSHSIGQGCPLCKLKSSGENIIRKWLIDNKIEFQQQKRFDTCVGTRNRLPFDFYLPKFKLLIEYDGKQHSSDKSWGGKNRLIELQENDRIKTKWALENNIRLLRISYKDKKSVTSIISAAIL